MLNRVSALEGEARPGAADGSFIVPMNDPGRKCMYLPHCPKAAPSRRVVDNPCLLGLKG